jgi:sugar phosphate isomerase/epimerase
MPAPIAVQLYSVREELKTDFTGVITRLAEIGYAGVEPFGAPDNLREAAQLYQDLGLDIPSAHVPLPVGENTGKVLEIAEAYGLERIISGLGPDQFKTLADVKRSCDTFNEVGRFAAENGLVFGVHNHWWEYQPVEGQYPYQILLKALDPSIFFQIDVYWVQTAGVDPLKVLREIGTRAPLLHIKDGPAVRDEPMTALGEGKLDIPAIVGAGSAEWLIVELDRCATDMQEAVEKSFRYLVKENLGRGK